MGTGPSLAVQAATSGPRRAVRPAFQPQNSCFLDYMIKLLDGALSGAAEGFADANDGQVEEILEPVEKEVEKEDKAKEDEAGEVSRPVGKPVQLDDTERSDPIADEPHEAFDISTPKARSGGAEAFHIGTPRAEEGEALEPAGVVEAPEGPPVVPAPPDSPKGPTHRRRRIVQPSAPKAAVERASPCEVDTSPTVATQPAALAEKAMSGPVAPPRPPSRPSDATTRRPVARRHQPVPQASAGLDPEARPPSRPPSRPRTCVPASSVEVSSLGVADPVPAAANTKGTRVRCYQAAQAAREELAEMERREVAASRGLTKVETTTAKVPPVLPPLPMPEKGRRVRPVTDRGSLM